MHLIAICKGVLSPQVKRKGGTLSQSTEADKIWCTPKLLFPNQMILQMKLTAIFILAFWLQASSKGLAQTINLSGKNMPMEKVFSLIEKQTDYVFFYPYSSIKEAKPITVSIKNASIEQVLTLCFKDQPFTYLITEKTIVVSQKIQKIVLLEKASLTTTDVRGKVTNEKGEPIENITVTVKGTNKATATKLDGSFLLTGVDEKAILVFSSVGFESREMPVDGRTDFVVTLKLKVTAMQDVAIQVNTGYQIIPKERATGSFAYIDNKRLNEQVSTDLISRLEAISNGLMVDRATNANGRIMIRGLSTIQGPKEALIVVDNFPFDGDLNAINPNDVESITILKDAAAASIWGTKAGNGVIVITTKKGRFNQPVTIEFSSNFTRGEKPDLFKLKNLSTSEYIDVEQFLYGKGYYNSTLNSSNKTAVTPVVEILVKKARGLLTPAQAEEQIDALRSLDVRNDFLKYFYQPSFNQQYALTARGGSNAHSWAMTAGVDKNQSVLDEDYTRVNLRFQNSIRLSNRIHIDAGLNYTQSANNNGKPGYGNVDYYLGRLYPYAQLADESGQPLPLIKEYRQAYVDTAGGGKLLNWAYYPLDDYKHSTTKGQLHSLLGNFGLNYKIVQGLTADVKYQYLRQQNTNTEINSEESFAMRNLINRYTQLNRATGEVSYALPRGGRLINSNDFLQSHNVRGQLEYNNEWKKHELSVLAGGELRETSTNFTRSGLYGYDPEIQSYANIDYARQHPTIINGSMANIPNLDILSGRLNRFVSAFSNAAYTFNSKYTFSLSARRDASNLFGVATNDKWNPLWSSGLSWNIGSEPFYHLSFLPSLKLRATYGFSGNVDPSRAAVTTMQYNFVASPFLLIPWANFQDYANPDLRWEKSGMLNIGLDFKLNKNILSGSVEYFTKRGTDLFGYETIDNTMGNGGERITRNVAKMKGQGFDLDLTSVNIKSGSFQWATDLNFSIYKDQVTEYSLASLRGSRFLGAQSSVSGLTGKPVFSIFSYKWAGLDPLTGDPRGYLKGAVSKDYTALTGEEVLLTDLKYHGSALPTKYGSLGNTLNYKGISVTARLLFKLGYYFRRSSVVYSDLFTGFAAHDDFSKRWQKPGDELITNVPSLAYPSVTNRNNFYRYSEVLIAKGDHIRLQYISAGYELTKEKWKALPLQRLHIYINLNNLGILWRANDNDTDPDYIYNSRFSLPPSKNYSAGIKASF